MKTAPVSEGRVATRGGDLSGFPHRRNLAKHLACSSVGGCSYFALSVRHAKFESMDRAGVAILDFDKPVERTTVLRGAIRQHDALYHLEHVSDISFEDSFGVHVIAETVGQIAAPPPRNFHLTPPTRGTLTGESLPRLSSLGQPLAAARERIRVLETERKSDGNA